MECIHHCPQNDISLTNSKHTTSQTTTHLQLKPPISLLAGLQSSTRKHRIEHRSMSNNNPIALAFTQHSTIFACSTVKYWFCLFLIIAAAKSRTRSTEVWWRSKAINSLMFWLGYRSNSVFDHMCATIGVCDSR